MPLSEFEQNALASMGVTEPTPTGTPEPAPAPAPAAPEATPATPVEPASTEPASPEPQGNEEDEQIRKRLQFVQTEYQQLVGYTKSIDPNFEQNYLERARARRKGKAEPTPTTASEYGDYLTPEQVKALAKEGFSEAQREIQLDAQIQNDLRTSYQMLNTFQEKYSPDPELMKAADQYVLSNYTIDIEAPGGPQSYARAMMDYCIKEDLQRHFNRRVMSASATAAQAAKAATLGVVPTATTAPLSETPKSPQMARLDQMMGFGVDRNQELFGKKTG